MATTVQVATPARSAGPIAQWHLLSLDAPSVAALWVWFIAQTQHIRLAADAPIAMALAVWILYATDRLLDTRTLTRPSGAAAGDFEARHFFHHRHRKLFLAGIAASAIALAALLFRLDAAAIRLYVLEGSLLVAWLAVLHATRSAHRLPKEIAVGFFFSAAVFIPTVARAPGLRPSLLLPAIVFALLCSINCLYIYAWEHEGYAPHAKQPHLTTRLALSRLPALGIGLLIVASALALAAPHPARAICGACALSFALLLALHRNRHRISRTRLRAAADLALLPPLLFLPFL